MGSLREYEKAYLASKKGGSKMIRLLQIMGWKVQGRWDKKEVVTDIIVITFMVTVAVAVILVKVNK